MGTRIDANAFLTLYLATLHVAATMSRRYSDVTVKLTLSALTFFRNGTDWLSRNQEVSALVTDTLVIKYLNPNLTIRRKDDYAPA